VAIEHQQEPAPAWSDERGEMIEDCRGASSSIPWKDTTQIGEMASW
jgi:hypothetical protein